MAALEKLLATVGGESESGVGYGVFRQLRALLLHQLEVFGSDLGYRLDPS